MSEDEGTNADAQAVPSEEESDDVAEGEDHSAGRAEETGSADDTEDSTTADSETEATADASVEDESVVEPTPSSDLPESTADIAGHETDEDLDQLLEELPERAAERADHDEELAQQIDAVVEYAKALDRTVDDQRAELEDLSERIEGQAETIGEVQATVEEYEAEIEDLQSRLKRKQADFQNYKKRAKKRQEQMKERATEDLVERLVGVRDNLKRALEEESGDVDSLRDGVDMTLREFDRVLEDENVAEIDPEPGTDVDPQRHEVMMNVDSEQPEGTVADVFTPGYEMGEKVIQNAQVTVSNGELADEDAANATAGEETAEDEEGATGVEDEPDSD